jgi:2-polyprenyl-6-methoxyphenol hydroxylase-like FAD-dependent oxidoreductase
MTKKVIVFGGGTAGWMAASFFYEKEGYDITVIESPDYNPIEMSASTTPYLKRFFQDIGINDESEWMPECKATYKLGVLYDDWYKLGGRWWNSFEADDWYASYWNKMRVEENLPMEDFYYSRIMSAHIGMKDSAKMCMNKDGKMAYCYQPPKSYGGHPEPWAYNLDTGELNNFLRTRYKDKVKLVITTIDDVLTNDNGISELIDENGKSYSADLYIDCSGFQSRLIEEVQPDGRIPLEPYLTHDRAIVVDVPYEDPYTEMRPRTGTKALSAGWMWNIPLYDRMVNGYVYTSEYISPEDAEKELIETIGADRIKDSQLRHMRIKTGHYARPYSKNVLALGISAGFIEPMEATLLMIVQFCLNNAHEYFAGNITKDEFNDKYENTLFDTLDWISTQYYLSKRDDSEFWRFKSGNETQIRPRMVEWLKSCEKEILPPEEDILFYPSLWYAKLIGFERYPEGDGFPDKEDDMLPTYSGTNFPPQNRFKYKEMDEVNARMVMEQRRSFDDSVFISQKEYLDRFIYKVK